MKRELQEDELLLIEEVDDNNDDDFFIIDDFDLLNDTKEINEKKNTQSKENNKLKKSGKSSIENKTKKKTKKILYILPILLIITGVLVYSLIKYFEEKAQEEKLRQEQETILTIKEHFNNYVKVTSDSILYDCNEKNECSEKGTVYQNIELTLQEMTIDKDTKYFYIPQLDSHISYQDVTPINELQEDSERYKNYLPFNKNIVTNNNFTLYRDDQKVYTFNESMTFPIIINNYEGKYYVEFDKKLYYLLEDDIKEIITHNNTTLKNAKSVTTFCYHRVYDTNEKCNDIYICKKKSSFDQEMKYLKDNNYLTLTMEEMYLYLTGKLQIQKGVLVTFDDGYLMNSAIDVLEKYNLNGNLFVITSRFKNFDSFISPNLELHSHTHSMHTAGQCAGYGSQGGGILCLKEDKVIEDLTTSRKLLNNPIALAYPFYDYNTRAINLLKETGFKMAFIGKAGVNGKSSPGVNLYKIPRVTIWDTTSFSKWKGYLS